MGTIALRTSFIGLNVLSEEVHLGQKDQSGFGAMQIGGKEGQRAQTPLANEAPS
jgi:hypothetical protein